MCLEMTLPTKVPSGNLRLNSKSTEDLLQLAVPNGFTGPRSSIFPLTSSDECGRVFNFVGNVRNIWKMRSSNRQTGMVQTQVTAQGWLGSTPEGRRPQIRGWRAGARSLLPARPQPPRALLTREHPGVEPCLIPCGPSWSLRRLPALASASISPSGATRNWVRFACVICYGMLRFPASLKIWETMFSTQILNE